MHSELRFSDPNWVHDSIQEIKLRTRLTDGFGIQNPIVCAPMGLVTGGRLAAAVSSAGGLGIVGGGYAGTLGGEPDIRQELAHVQGHKFAVGFITWALARSPHVLDQALSLHPFVCFSHSATQHRSPSGFDAAARS
jgi:nitronate monooxygenase